MNKLGLTISRQVSKIGERFQRKLENLRNYYALICACQRFRVTDL